MLINIIIALNAEAKHILKKLNILNSEENEYFKLYKSKIYGIDLNIFTNLKSSDGFDKIGTTQASILTCRSILYQKPDLILNLGTCGGIEKNNAYLNDVIYSNEFVIYHDRYFSNLREKYAVGFFKCKEINDTKLFKIGVIASGNSLVLNNYSWNIIEKFQVRGVDMEAAAIAEVANEFNIEFICIKVVSDIINDQAKEEDIIIQFKNNFNPSMEILSERFEYFLQYLSKNNEERKYT